MSLWGINVFEVGESHFQELLPNYSSAPHEGFIGGSLEKTDAFYSAGGLLLRQNKDPRYPTEATYGGEGVLTS